MQKMTHPPLGLSSILHGLIYMVSVPFLLGLPCGAHAQTSGVSKVDASVQRQAERTRMVDSQLASRGIKDPRILAVMKKIPRHAFIPPAGHRLAYRDHPVRIGHDQTISQPYIVGFMTEVLSPDEAHRVLEIGTGSGYQAAVLAELVKEVYTIEIVPPLAVRARKRLDQLGYKNIRYRIGDGYQGWPDAGPFDRIILTAAPPKIPAPLLAQLKLGGVMIAPIGRAAQALVKITRTKAGYTRESILPVRFVPMTGRAQKDD